MKIVTNSKEVEPQPLSECAYIFLIYEITWARLDFILIIHIQMDKNSFYKIANGSNLSQNNPLLY